MGSATSMADSPRFTSAGASFARLLDFLAGAFFLAAMRVLLRFQAEDDARSTAIGEIGPGPVYEHDEPAAEADQEKDVQQQPEPPGDDAREFDVRELRHGRMPADGRQR